MKIEELALEPATEEIRNGDLSPVELTQLFLRRIAKLNAAINAFLFDQT